MKALIFICSLFVSILGFAQPQLSMDPTYGIMPATALSPTQGVAYGGTVSITCYVRNVGNATFSTGGLALHRAVVSGTFVSAVRVIYSVSVAPTILPGDSVMITAVDSVVSTAYKINGNGNTIVVWPISSGAATKDSLDAGPVYVSDPTGIEELDRNTLFIFPNPVSHTLYIKPEQGRRYKELIIYDIQLKELMREPFSERADIGSLPPGAYIISVLDEEGKRYSSRFVKNN